MELNNEDILRKCENHKESISENINKAKELGINKITAILVLSEEEIEIRKVLINWLVSDVYKVSLKREDYDIITIEW